MSITIDPQQRGTYDNGTPEGVVLTKAMLGDLVRVPFHSQMTQIDNGGNATAAFQRTGVSSNPDGSMTGIYISTTAQVAGTGVGGLIWVPFWGRAFGVRHFIQVNALLNSYDFNVFVDGVAKRVTTVPQGWVSGELTTSTYAEALTIVDDDLGDGPHLACIACPGGVAPRSWMFHGTLLDRRAGYSELPRQLMIMPPVTITASQVAVGFTPAVIGNFTMPALRYIRKILYTNTTGGAVTVTVQLSSSTIWATSLAGGESTAFDPGDRMLTNIILTQAAGATSSINATVLGGF